MAVMEGRLVTGGNGGIFQTEKSRHVLDVEDFWLSDKFRIRAVREFFNRVKKVNFTSSGKNWQ